MSETTPQAGTTTDAPPESLPTPIRWLLVLPAAIGGALAMTIGSVFLVSPRSASLWRRLTSVRAQAPGYKEKVAMVLAAKWAIGLTSALVYMSAIGGVSGAGDWVLLVACSVAGVIAVVWGIYYARTEGEATS